MSCLPALPVLPLAVALIGPLAVTWIGPLEAMVLVRSAMGAVAVGAIPAAAGCPGTYRSG